MNISKATIHRFTCIFLIPYLVALQPAIFSAGIQAQSVTPCTTAINYSNFGVEADLYANTPANTNGDDWFNSLVAGANTGVIGLTAATAKPPLVISASAFRTLLQNANSLSARNRIYQQRMGVPIGAVLNGQIPLDGIAARDYFSTSSLTDSTMFSGTGDKNGANPLTWNPNIGNVSQKLDLIDVGGHIRRDVATNHLRGFCFATTLNTSGDSHIDFELYRSNLTLNAVTHKATNTGPTATGGHTAAFFNNNGVLTQPGDIIISVDYGTGGSNPTATVRIWVNPNKLDGTSMTTATFNTKPNRPFTFTGVFDAQSSTGTNGYGYAEISPLNPGGGCLFYSLTNKTFKTKGTPWGNLVAGGEFRDSIDVLQLAEMAIDFTAFGLDVGSLLTPCQALFGSMLVKSRSSGSFTAQQKDYAGPYDFGASIQVSASAGPDKQIDCSPGNSSVQLQGSSSASGVVYSWTVVPNSGGNIVSGANTATPTVNAAGCYALLVSSSGSFSNCNAKDTACVTETVIPAPSITCPSGFTVCPNSVPSCIASLSAFITAGGTASTTAPPLTFNCSAGTLVGGNCGGTVTRTYSVTDACGNSSSCTQIITVNDVTKPVITNCPADVRMDCGSTAPAATGTATATDNCSVQVTYADVNNPQSCYSVITRTWTATDPCGNRATCVQHIVSVDLTPPSFTCPGNVQLNCGTNIPQPAVNDNCTPSAQITVFFRDALTAGSGCANSSNRTRTWTAIDARGNTSTCVQQISFAQLRTSGENEDNSGDNNTNTGTSSYLVTPSDFQLKAYPNPFDRNVTIEFTPAIEGDVKLEICDLNGAVVAELFKGSVEKDKLYKFDFSGDKHAQGIYLFKLNSPNGKVYSDKLILMR